MIYKNCTQEDLVEALRIINKKYDDNVTFNRFDAKGFTIRVKDSKKAGRRVHRSYNFDGLHHEKRSTSACWHVHGDFFDALFLICPDAVIVSQGRKITRDFGNWEDCNIGSKLFPVMLSESCDCNV